MFTTSPKNLQYLQYLQFPYTVIAANGTYCRYCTFSRDLENLIAVTRQHGGYETVLICCHPCCASLFFVSIRTFFSRDYNNSCHKVRYAYKFPILKPKQRSGIRMVLFENVSGTSLVVYRQYLIFYANIKGLLIVFGNVDFDFFASFKIMVCGKGAHHLFWFSPRPARRDQHQYQSNISHSDIITHSVSYCNGYDIAGRHNRWANNST